MATRTSELLKRMLADISRLLIGDEPSSPMKGEAMDEEYKKQIKIYNAELDRLNDMLTTLDPASDTYQKTADAIKKVQEAKLSEEKAHSERRSSIVPDWVPKVLSVIATSGMCVMIYRGEVTGKVIGSAAASMLNKLKF